MAFESLEQINTGLSEVNKILSIFSKVVQPPLTIEKKNKRVFFSDLK